MLWPGCGAVWRSRSRLLGTHSILSFIIISFIPFRFRWSIFIDVIFFMSFSFKAKSYTQIHRTVVDVRRRRRCPGQHLPPNERSILSDNEMNAHTHAHNLFSTNLVEQTNKFRWKFRIRSCAGQRNQMCLLTWFSFCSNKICPFDILSSVDHLNSIFPLVRTDCNRICSPTSKRKPNPPNEYSNESKWTKQHKQNPSVIEIDSRLSVGEILLSITFKVIKADQEYRLPPSCCV